MRVQAIRLNIPPWPMVIHSSYETECSPELTSCSHTMTAKRNNKESYRQHFTASKRTVNPEDTNQLFILHEGQSAVVALQEHHHS